MPEFKDMLKYYRERMGLSQRDFAKRINIAPATVGMYEQGKRHPDFETEEKIADFFNVSLDNLRGRDDETTTKGPAEADPKILEMMSLLEDANPEDVEKVLQVTKVILHRD